MPLWIRCLLWRKGKERKLGFYDKKVKLDLLQENKVWIACLAWWQCLQWLCIDAWRLHRRHEWGFACPVFEEPPPALLQTTRGRVLLALQAKSSAPACVHQLSRLAVSFDIIYELALATMCSLTCYALLTGLIFKLMIYASLFRYSLGQ
jgi:hypothetical protein